MPKGMPIARPTRAILVALLTFSLALLQFAPTSGGAAPSVALTVPHGPIVKAGASPTPLAPPSSPMTGRISGDSPASAPIVAGTPAASPPFDWVNESSRLGSHAGPGPRDFTEFTWDQAANTAILFGGDNGATIYGDTWTYAPGWGWNLTTATGPTGRTLAQMTWDSEDNYVLLQGGCAGSFAGCPQYVNTWSYTMAGGWTNQGADGLTVSRTSAGLADDPADGYSMMFGGCTSWNFGVTPPVCNALINDTWTFKGGTWTQLTPPTAPSPRYLSQMAYDPATREIVLFGGLVTGASGNPIAVDDTWTYSAGTWTNVTGSAGTAPPPTAAGTLSYVSSVGGLVLFGGGTASMSADGQSWSFVNGVWSRLHPETAPTPRLGASFATSFTGTGGVLWGGYQNGTGAALSYANDTWVPGTSPLVQATETPATTDAGLAVAFGSTVSGGQSPYAYSWSFGDGSPVSTSPNPSHAYANPGTYSVTVTVTDSNGATGSFSLSTTVNPDPTAALSATPSSPAVGQTVQFLDTITGGTSPMGSTTWSYGDGSAKVVGGSTASYAYPRAGTFVVNVSTQDAVGAWANHSTTLTVTNQPLVLSAARTPAAGAVPLTVTFSASATGGSSAATFSWVFGDGSVGSGPSLSHPYRTAGVYTARVWANDSAGHSATSSLMVWAYPTLSVSAALSANQTYPGTAVTVSATPTGGNGSLTYAWSLNGSAYGAGGPSVSYTPAGAANYSFSVTVTDASGDHATARTVLQVVSRSSSSSPPLTVSLVLSSSSVRAGTNVTATASPQNSDGGVTYLWTLNGSLPLPHAGGSSAVALFTLDHGGSYQVHVSASDLLHSAWAQTSLAVTYTGALPPPLSITLSANSTKLPVHSSVVLNATPSGGAPPYLVFWILNSTDNLTTQGSALTTFSYRLDHPGTYTFRAWVMDQANQRAYSYAVVVAVSAPGGQSGGGTGPGSSSVVSGVLHALGIGLYLLLALIVALLLVALYIRRRRSREGTPPGGSAASVEAVAPWTGAGGAESATGAEAAASVAMRTAGSAGTGDTMAEEPLSEPVHLEGEPGEGEAPTDAAPSAGPGTLDEEAPESDPQEGAEPDATAAAEAPETGGETPVTWDGLGAVGPSTDGTVGDAGPESAGEPAPEMGVDGGPAGGEEGPPPSEASEDAGSPSAGGPVEQPSDGSGPNEAASAPLEETEAPSSTEGAPDTSPTPEGEVTPSLRPDGSPPSSGSEREPEASTGPKKMKLKRRTTNEG